MNQVGMDALQKQLYSDPELFIMGSAAMMPFRLSSCQSMHYSHQGMPGRVLRSGCVQVVQNLRIIPEVLHPRCRLPEQVAAGVVGEMVYIPVYDLHAPHAGPVAVLEALLSATATDSMLVANFISVAGNVLSCSQLSLSNPLPQPVRRSRLEGRKPRPVHPDSTPDFAQCCHTPQQATDQAEPSAAAQGDCQALPQAASGQQPGCGVPLEIALPGQQQPQLTSCSSGSAGTIVAAVSAGTPTSCPAEYHLSSTLSSRPSENYGNSHVQGVDAAAAAPGCEAEALAAGGAMLPPRPYGATQHRRRWQQDGSADGSQDSELLQPPCKLRRTLSMARTKSVPLGLDQILLEAMGGSELTASC